MKNITFSIMIMICIILFTGCNDRSYTPEKEVNVSVNENKDSENTVKHKLLEKASVQNCALQLYKFDGQNTTWRIVIDKEWEQKVVDEINSLNLSPADENELSKWSEPCYGVNIGDAEGWEIWLTYSNGLWLEKDGSLYRADFDIARYFDEASERENTIEYTFDSGIQIPNAAILSKYSIKYCKKITDELTNEKDGVTFKFISLDGDIATLEYQNNSDKEFQYGEPYYLQKIIDGSWYGLPVAKSNYGFNDILNLIKPGQSRQTKCDLSLYGELEDGWYRIVKDDFCADFSIPFLDNETKEKMYEEAREARKQEIWAKASFDIDGDGIIEDCTITPGPNSGVCTAFITAYVDNVEKYSNLYYLKHGNFSFSEENGEYFIVIDCSVDGENWQTERHRIYAEEGTIIIDDMKLAY